jgi:hypothetical protein
MDFLKKLFNSPIAKKQCPRCLGKGHVDLQDIKRLKNGIKVAAGHMCLLQWYRRN